MTRMYTCFPTLWLGAAVESESCLSHLKTHTQDLFQGMTAAVYTYSAALTAEVLGQGDGVRLGCGVDIDPSGSQVGHEFVVCVEELDLEATLVGIAQVPRDIEGCTVGDQGGEGSILRHPTRCRCPKVV